MMTDEKRNLLREKVILALDYDSPEKAFRLVEEVGDLVQWYKVGAVLFTRSGVEIAQFLHQKRKKIFLDLKLHDTPTVVADTVKQYVDLGAQYATVHCIGGRRMLDAAARSCRGSRLKLIGVTLLTSHGPTDGGALDPSVDESGLVLRLLDVALEARLTGILCSPHELESVRARMPQGFQLVAAGIRVPGQEVFQDDQVRVASPQEAVRGGADFLIVGRPVTQAREPREAVERLFPS